jgi:hypothetical protein
LSRGVQQETARQVGFHSTVWQQHQHIWAELAILSFPLGC